METITDQDITKNDIGALAELYSLAQTRKMEMRAIADDEWANSYSPHVAWGREPAEQVISLLQRGRALRDAGYKLVYGDSCDVTIRPRIRGDVIVWQQRCAGYIGTAEQHRLVGIVKKDKE